MSKRHTHDAKKDHRSHVESRILGNEQHRAVCSCGWASTWQPGLVSLAENAASDHIWSWR